jgi:hypothetical protein
MKHPKRTQRKKGTGHGTGTMMPASLRTILDRGRYPRLYAGAVLNEREGRAKDSAEMKAVVKASRLRAIAEKLGTFIGEGAR